MRYWFLPVLALAVLLAGCMTAEQRHAADEEKCRSYGFKKRNDAFAECMQRLDLDRRARLRRRTLCRRVCRRQRRDRRLTAA